MPSKPLVFGCLAAPVVAYYYPTAFIIATNTGLIYLYLLHEKLDERSPTTAKHPSFEDFMENNVQYVDTQLEDDCIICRDEPTDPMQLLPCQHIFCNSCFALWIAQNRRSCPQCTQVLFESSRRTLEKQVKLLTAVSFVALLLTLFDIAHGPISRPRIVIDTLVIPHLVGEMIRTIFRRYQHGAAWWRDIAGATDRPDEENEGVQTVTVWMLCFVEGVWLVSQALIWEKRMPDYFLWNILFSRLQGLW